MVFGQYNNSWTKTINGKTHQLVIDRTTQKPSVAGKILLKVNMLGDLEKLEKIVLEKKQGDEMLLKISSNQEIEIEKGNYFLKVKHRNLSEKKTEIVASYGDPVITITIK